MTVSTAGSEVSAHHERNTKLDARVGKAASVIMPLAQLAALGFATYVLVYQICVQYLISPSIELRLRYGVRPRRGMGIALIVVYAIVALVLLLTWIRLLQVIWTNPGVVPQGDRSAEKMSTNSKTIDQYAAYISDYDGRPQWCDKCHNWKPDRTHHCKELGRCVRRMDHYCPWAGGIIGETTHKFFVQFVFYGGIYTGYTLVVTAIFFAERTSKAHSRPSTWIAALALCSIFFVFTCTMFFMTAWNVTINYTSVESIQRGGIHNIAFQISPNSPSNSAQYSNPPSNPNIHPSDMPNVLRIVQRGDSSSRYVVMQTHPMEHPWDMGNMRNWKSVMGNRPIDWFLPIKMSPCTRHTDRRGEYEWGEIVMDMATKYQALTPTVQLQLLADSRR